jgi:hypothetical protein
MTRRSIVTFVDFLEKVEAWIPPKGVERIYAIMDNLKAPNAYDVLPFSLAHPRWKFVFQPKYATCKSAHLRSGAEGIRTPDLRRAKAARYFAGDFWRLQNACK